MIVDVLLLIRSSLNSTVVIYRLRLTAGSEAKISDPAKLTVQSANIESLKRVLSLHLIPVKMRGDINEAVTISDPNHDSDNARFALLTTLQTDFSVTQVVYVVAEHAELASRLGPPTWNSKLKRSFHNEIDDDFIDKGEYADGFGPGRMPCEPVSNFVKRVREPRIVKTGDWTVNYELVVRKLDDVDVADVTGMDEVIENIEEWMRTEPDSKSIPFRTLNDLFDGEITLQDVEGASTQLQRLTLKYTSQSADNEFEYNGKEEGDYRALLLQRMEPMPFLDLPYLDLDDPLNTIYESLSEAWTRQQPGNAGEIVRHARDQIAKRVAAEVTMASIVVVPQRAEVERLPEVEAETQAKGNIWELPVRPGAPLSARSTPSVYLDAQSQSQSPRSPRLPTPSETGSSASTRVANLALTRLSHYTTFSSTPKPAPLSRRLNRVLSHWTVGADPATYDWSTTSRHFSRREEEDAQDEEMTEKERLRQQRRTERYVRRQQREAEETARMQMLSSQAPAILTSSQPARGGSQQIGVGGDSQNQSQSQARMAASQVLPGRHGGRPAKKKRKQGF